MTKKLIEVETNEELLKADIEVLKNLSTETWRYTQRIDAIIKLKEVK